MTVLQTWVRALALTQNASHLTLPSLINPLAETYGERPALIGPHATLSYRDLAARVNRYTRWALAAQIDGEVIGLLLDNDPDYVALWLGLTRAGCTVALLNTHLPAAALAHSLAVAHVTHLIVGQNHLATLDPIREAVTTCFVWPDLRAGLETYSAAPVDDLPAPRTATIALLLSTSGTTGLPKAARITHRRITEWSYWFAGMMDATPDDCLYDCLPMYHSVGGIVAVGAMLVSGGSVVIRPRFSARQFWPDMVQHRCTIFQYIGELCRYLTQQAPDEREHQHHLRLAVGNGLADGVWQRFQDRFAIPQILEFYAATEGNLSLYNVEGKPGAIGRIPKPLEPHFAVKLIRLDPANGEPVRDANGLCSVCAPGETGEAIALLKQRQFDGYNDAEATQRKILHDVVVNGDQWFRSGDLMRQDAERYFYFVDRLGDTYRWKGENVATTEVAAVVQTCPGVIDAMVYGVVVAGQEGRAGMAAIIASDAFDLDRLVTHLQAHLPAYARPLYVRICSAFEMTGTFKLSKTKLAAEAVAGTDDPVWAIDQPHCLTWVNPPVLCRV